MREYYPDIVSYMLGADEDGEPIRYSLVHDEILNNTNLKEDFKEHFSNYKMTMEGDAFHEENIGGMYRNRVCITKDGILISIQCGEGFYSWPRASFPLEPEWLGIYESFEIGFPSQKIEEFMEYAETPKTPTDTVYSCVPKELVNKFITEHGGIAPLDKEETRRWNHRKDDNINGVLSILSGEDFKEA